MNNKLTRLLATYTCPISSFKVNPMATMEKASGKVVAVLNRNTPVFYCVPAEEYRKMLDKLEGQNNEER